VDRESELLLSSVLVREAERRGKEDGQAVSCGLRCKFIGFLNLFPARKFIRSETSQAHEDFRYLERNVRIFPIVERSIHVSSIIFNAMLATFIVFDVIVMSSALFLTLKTWPGN
jgi:hypothetical protein